MNIPDEALRLIAVSTVAALIPPFGCFILEAGKIMRSGNNTKHICRWQKPLLYFMPCVA
jgi:hypothetical protein